MAYIGRQNLGGAYRQLDDISSGFDGSDTTHTMQVNSANVTVGDVNQIILSLGGVIQKPGTDFTVSGSVLTFTTAPAANTSFFAVLLGSDNGGTVTPTDGSVTGDKVASSGAFTIGAAGTASSLAGIPFFQGDTGSIYTHDVSGTDDSAQYNTAYGLTALDAITTGDKNIAIGYAALGASTTVAETVAIGHLAGGTGVGTSGLNVIVGNEAAEAVTSMSEAVVIGYRAAEANTTGSHILAIGYQAYDGADTENHNLAIGSAALGGSVAGGEYNVAVGNYTLDALTSGDYNTALGYAAGTDLTTGDRNTFIGHEAGKDCIGGGQNVAIGDAAGSGALSTAAGRNVMIGRNAGQNLTSGDSNVFIGFETGVNNVAVDTGTDNILIGNQARANQTNAANQISLGTQVTCQGDNNFTFGNGATDSNIVFGATGITAPSDERYKEEIATSTAGLSFINDLRPVTFKWKKEKDLPSDHEAYVEGSDTRVMLSTGETNHGFIAQEVKAAIDAHSEIKDGFKMWSEEQRYDIDGNIIEDGRQRVAPSELIPVLTKAVQELSAQITTLQNEVNTLKGE
jgi:hypothetical protein